MKLGKILGIKVDLHWSFFLMLGLFTSLAMFGSMATSFVVGVALFLIILIHEFGHILTARYLGYPVRGITLHLLGGVAMTEGKPNELWWQKFLVILFGPLTNLILGVLLFFIIDPIAWEAFLLIQKTPEPQLISAFGFWTFCLCYIYLVNWVILVFNLIPVFPLDGGQLFQSGAWGMFRLFGIRNDKARNISNVFACSIGMVLAAACSLFFFINLNLVVGFMFLFGMLICYVTMQGSIDELKGKANRFLTN